jgi:hypothetical protein
MSLGLIIHAVVAAIAFLSIAYLVYATAQKSEGTLKSVGVILAAVLAALGVLVLIGHLSAPMTGGRPFGLDLGPAGPAVSSSTAPSGGGTATTTSDAGKPNGEPSSGDTGAKP